MGQAACAGDIWWPGAPGTGPPCRQERRPDVTELADPAGVRQVSAVKVVESIHCCEARARIDGLQQRAELGRRAAAEVVGRAGDEPATLLPRAGAVRIPRREQRVELRTVRRVDAVRAADRVAERWVVLGALDLDRGKISLERRRGVVRGAVREWACEQK